MNCTHPPATLCKTCILDRIVDMAVELDEFGASENNLIPLPARYQGLTLDEYIDQWTEDYGVEELAAEQGIGIDAFKARMKELLAPAIAHVPG